MPRSDPSLEWSLPSLCLALVNGAFEQRPNSKRSFKERKEENVWQPSDIHTF